MIKLFQLRNKPGRIISALVSWRVPTDKLKDKVYTQCTDRKPLIPTSMGKLA